MSNKNGKNVFSTKELIISMVIAWVIVFFGAWAGKRFSIDFFAMPRFAFVLVLSFAGAVVIGPAIYGFLYVGKNSNKKD